MAEIIWPSNIKPKTTGIGRERKVGGVSNWLGLAWLGLACVHFLENYYGYFFFTYRWYLLIFIIKYIFNYIKYIK